MESEAEIEDKLINQLKHGKSQWNFRDDLKTEDQLWTNFFRILTSHNQDILNGVPLTENEKAVIKSKIVHPTFYKSAEWLAGANGMVKLPIQRDDTKLGVADLVVIDNTNIAGGSSVYEVVHQIQLHKRDNLGRNRRYDVTLLINGLPMIHIELKNRMHSIKEAFNQIQKYIDQQMFNGIYSTTQVFVISNGTETKYIAAGQQLREKFLTTWVDENNKPVHDYLSFAKRVLSIPMAHKLVTEYIVLDKEQQNIIVLRPYQIQAIEAINKVALHPDDSSNIRSGYVWHTTGSGKTLTSYKVAHNLLSIPSINKTVFLIDRNDLDTQTTSAFKTYAQNDTTRVEETKNSYELARKLVSPNKQVIIATRQKMQALFKRIKKDNGQKRLYNKLQELNLAFVVDECHRTVSPDQKNDIDAFFTHKPMWFGFTGTPIFAENAKEAKGKNARTTAQQYGPCLAKYTIKDAIRDQAVLGFQVEEETYNSEETEDESDTKKLDQIYSSKDHMEAVVNQIFKQAWSKQGIFNKNHRGYIYSALFTTQSIKQAQRYYRYFLEIINDQEYDNKYLKRIRKIVPDYPKIAITYSVGENQDGADANQSEMKNSLKIYNAMYHTDFSMDELRAYNTNVSERLARKKEQYKPRDQQLDMVIVVDRMLTGFDAPSLSALYLDRPPLPYKNLIQAFSRTNRIFDQDKKFGQIVTFQYPKKYKEDINGAISLYSDGGTNEVMAPKWDTSKALFENAEKKIVKYSNVSQDTILNAPIKEQEKFAKEYQNFDKTLAAAETYSQWDDVSLEKDYGINDSFVEETKAIYEVVKDNIKKTLPQIDPNVDEQPLDLDYELETGDKQTVDYRYILQLIQTYIPTDDNESVQKTNAEINEIDTYIDDLSKTNKVLAGLLQSLWDKVKQNPENFRNKQVNEILQTMMDEAYEELINDFSKKYCLNLDDLKFVIKHYDLSKDEYKQSGLNELLARNSFIEYKKEHPDTNMLMWKKNVRSKIRNFYAKKIIPITDK